MSEEKPLESHLYIVNNNLMVCHKYPWGHINELVGIIAWQNAEFEKYKTLEVKK